MSVCVFLRPSSISLVGEEPEPGEPGDPGRDAIIIPVAVYSVRAPYPSPRFFFPLPDTPSTPPRAPDLSLSPIAGGPWS